MCGITAPPHGALQAAAALRSVVVTPARASISDESSLAKCIAVPVFLEDSLLDIEALGLPLVHCIARNRGLRRSFWDDDGLRIHVWSSLAWCHFNSSGFCSGATLGLGAPVGSVGVGDTALEGNEP